MDRARVYDEVMARFRQAAEARFANERFRKVATLLWFLEGEMNKLLAQHPVQFWTKTLRSSITEQGGAIHREDIFRASHAILKFGQRNVMVADESDVDRGELAELARNAWAILTSYRAIQGNLRRLGKGGSIEFGLGEPVVTLPPAIERATTSYDRRRRFDELFADQGVPFSRSDAQGSYIVAMGVRYEEPPRLEPLVLNAYEICALLQQYDEPLEFTHGMKPEDLCHALVSLSKPIVDGLDERRPKFMARRIEDHGLEADLDRESADIAQRVAPLGYLSLSEQEIVRLIVETETPWRKTSTENQITANRFLERFGSIGVGAINIERNEGASILLPMGPSSFVIDFCNMHSFLISLVQDGKRYFESHHGDRFTMHLANRIKRIAPEYVRGLKVKFEKSGELPKGDADLLLFVNGVALCVECKARAMNEKLFRGEIEEVKERQERWDDAFVQAKDAAKHLQRGSFVDGEWETLRSSVTSYEPIVCSIMAEYVNPADKFGMTPQGLPRLCSMAELLAFCEQKKRGA